MKNSLLLIVTLLMFSVSASAQLYISEVYEANGGSGKFVELHNISASSIDLAAEVWTLDRYTNAGVTSSATIPLTGVVLPGAYFVVGHSDVDTIFGASTVDQLTSAINHNGNDKYILLKNAVPIDSFAGDRIGDTATFAANVVAHRLASAFPNNGDWNAIRAVSGSGNWETTAITSGNGNATTVATPGTSGGASGGELPVELMKFSVE